ncbi:MAG: META domain-containing protein [Rhodobacter sp.]|nr:META domain-containing protein [Paracoccaceae bacterium]MCC0075556.1 META domain-containing protein [Rhodobacter sp.]
MFRSLIRAAVLLLATIAPASADMVAFQSRLTGQYVGVDGAGLLAAQARGPQALVLDMIRLDGRRVAFRDPQSGMFLRAGVGQETFLAIASAHIRGWETFEMVQDGPDVTIRSVQNGLYVGTDGRQPRLAANWGTRGQGQTFRLVPVGAPAPQPVPQEMSRAPATDLAFAGFWRLDDLFVNGAPVSLNDRAMRQVQLTIGRRGALNGTSGCNEFDARLMEWRSAFRVEDFLTTRVGCQGERREIERLFVGAVTEAAHFAVVGGRLEIRDWNGRLRARMRRD